MNMPRALILKVIKIVVAIELGYLLLFNAALQIPYTQDLINMIRPHKFHIRWDNAWTWYPFRVHVRDASANGQSRSQQWQVDVVAVSGSISVLPLVLKRVYVRNVTVNGAEYRQRPRLKPDRDYSGILDHFPDIEGRDIVPADPNPLKKKRPWKVWISNARTDGDVRLWLFNVQGSLSGTATVDLTAQSRGGPFSLDATDIDLRLDPAFINGDTELFNGGSLQGSLGFAPFAPRDNRGLQMLTYLKLDTLLDLQVRKLAFINLFTSNLGNFRIRGVGRVNGRLRFDEGYMLAGTDVAVNAEDLKVSVKDMDILGQGDVRISTPQEADTPLTLAIGYDELAITREGDDRPFLRGDSLDLEYGGSNWVVPETDMDFQTFLNDETLRERRKDHTLAIRIEDATLLDMAILNDYLPAGSGLKFTGGSAQLNSDVDATPDDVQGGLTLRGSDVEMTAEGQALRGDLAVDLAITGGVPRQLRVELDGSRVTLDQVRVVGERQSFDDDTWATTVDFDRAEAVVVSPPLLSADARVTMSDTRPLVALFHNSGKTPEWVSNQLLLRDIDGQVSMELADNRLEIPDAKVLSDKAEVAAKAVFYETGRDGMIYARYRKLDVVLKMTGEKSNLDVFNAREKFDQYELRTVDGNLRPPE